MVIMGYCDLIEKLNMQGFAFLWHLCCLLSTINRYWPLFDNLNCVMWDKIPIPKQMGATHYFHFKKIYKLHPPSNRGSWTSMVIFYFILDNPHHHQIVGEHMGSFFNIFFRNTTHHQIEIRKPLVIIFVHFYF